MNAFLERHFDKWMPEPNSGCWIWFGSQTTAGYGNLTEAATSHYAHRRVFEETHGYTVIVRHRCDNPWCVNPDHLLGGTQLDNVRDMDARGRRRVVSVRGEAHGRAKLNPADIQSIRLDHRSLSRLAAHYGVSKTTISRIKKRLVWEHVP